ncbi:MAG: DUF362 domain-containing protein [Melioribacteraceae bacterium]|nr:DUF362 domain-containing protein [Melioribacteraceae bacterium]MCF8263720.1 DUF362 domain-containing protein [Melioribacteraceae bacterium]MCF8414002.1 DUF362 domain-containing protein [Melioribacteraceae bacterium]MCF8431743.1 DUF362 domain-containing protein [Melioribacteraceae bacterium]
MKRREFLRNTAVTTAALSLGVYPNLTAMPKKSFSSSEIFDLAAIKGNDPAAMFNKAIEALGGIKKFVKPNQTVVVKPNIGWDTGPERAANTNPELVSQIVKKCYEAGAKKVYVFDHTCDEWTRCYSNSLIEKAVNDAGGTVVPGNTERYYQDVKVPNGLRITEAKVHELILESDVFINVPVLKSHGGATLTIGMKNLMGIVWDRRFWHRNDLHQCIADFSTFRKPDLTVVDAYNVMKRNGPRGVSVDDVVSLNSQIISTDMVAADAAATKLFGLELNDVKYIGIADKMGVGTSDLSKLSINRMKL